MTDQPADPVLERRARIAGMVQLGKRLGWGCFGVAVVLFFVGLVAGYNTAITTVIVAALLLGSFTLAPAIVFGYAVRAAEREEQGLGPYH
jgi:hypothetical protein